MDDCRVVVDKSTVPVGTAGKVKAEIASQPAKRGRPLEFDDVPGPESLTRRHGNRRLHEAGQHHRPPDPLVSVVALRSEISDHLFELWHRNRVNVFFLDVARCGTRCFGPACPI